MDSTKLEKFALINKQVFKLLLYTNITVINNVYCYYLVEKGKFIYVFIEPTDEVDYFSEFFGFKFE